MRSTPLPGKPSSTCCPGCGNRLGLGLIVVTHDPWVAARLGGEVLVLHDGRTVEAGPAAEVLTRPAQPYTAALLAAAAR